MISLFQDAIPIEMPHSPDLRRLRQIPLLPTRASAQTGRAFTVRAHNRRNSDAPGVYGPALQWSRSHQSLPGNVCDAIAETVDVDDLPSHLTIFSDGKTPFQHSRRTYRPKKVEWNSACQPRSHGRKDVPPMKCRTRGLAP